MEPHGTGVKIVALAFEEHYMIGPREFWEGIFGGLDIESYDFSKSKPASVLASFCDRYLKDGSSVLDLGCGTGRNAHYLAERGYKVYGLDFALAAVKLCQKRFTRFHLPGIFVQATLDRIPFRDGFFSGVICVDTIDLITFERAQISLAEARRVLVPDGRILITFDPPDTHQDIIDEAEILPDGTLKFVRGKRAGKLFRRYQDAEIKSLLGEANIISFDYTAAGSRVIICR